MALIGFIIMLGRGLGEVLSKTKVSHTIVHKIVYGIGVNTKTKVKLGIVLSSLVIVALLGTLAGGLAILAPILRPIAGSVKLSRPSLAVLMQASGEEALILGPFAPPVVALLGVLPNLSYTHMLLFCSLPVALITLVTTWIMANKLQREYGNELCDIEENSEVFIPTSRQNIATLIFIGLFTVFVIFGLIYHAKTSYVIFVMFSLSLAVGLISGLSLTQIFNLIIEGMKKNFHLFIIFILLDPFLNLIEHAGGFHALTKIFIPLMNYGGRPVLSILIGITGAFGMPAASAAVIKMLHQMFEPSAITLGLTSVNFALSMLLATRVTNFAYPGANMFAAMGFAGSENIKAMIKNGLVVTFIQVSFLILYSILVNYF